MNEMQKPLAVEVFDESNNQIDYQFIAKTYDGKSVVGYIVIEKPWYSNQSDWTYWMYINQYGKGICGGASDLGLTKVMVNPPTIRPYNQIEKIKYLLNNGISVELVRELIVFDDESGLDNSIMIIDNIDDIPYEMWNKNKI